MSLLQRCSRAGQPGLARDSGSCRRTTANAQVGIGKTGRLSLPGGAHFWGDGGMEAPEGRLLRIANRFFLGVFCEVYARQPLAFKFHRPNGLAGPTTSPSRPDTASIRSYPAGIGDAEARGSATSSLSQKLQHPLLVRAEDPAGWTSVKAHLTRWPPLHYHRLTAHVRAPVRLASDIPSFPALPLPLTTVSRFT